MDFIQDDLTSTQLVSINLSEDRRYLMLIEKKLINLKAIDLLAHEDERVRQAYHISRMFDRYIDHNQRNRMVEELNELLVLRVIELKTNEQGEPIVNVLRNKGQTALLRLLLKYTTPQKRHSLKQSQPFNALKRLLMERMRHQGLPISVNSLSVTLSRAVKTA